MCCDGQKAVPEYWITFYAVLLFQYAVTLFVYHVGATLINVNQSLYSPGETQRVPRV